MGRCTAGGRAESPQGDFLEGGRPCYFITTWLGSIHQCPGHWLGGKGAGATHTHTPLTPIVLSVITWGRGTGGSRRARLLCLPACWSPPSHEGKPMGAQPKRPVAILPFDKRIVPGNPVCLAGPGVRKLRLPWWQRRTWQGLAEYWVGSRGWPLWDLRPASTRT